MIPLRWLVIIALALVVFVVGYTLTNQFPPPTIRVSSPLSEAPQTRTPTPQERQMQVVTLTNATEGEPVVFLPLPTSSPTPSPRPTATTEPSATATLPTHPSASSPVLPPTPTTEVAIPAPTSDEPQILRFELDTSSVPWDGSVTATWETTGYTMVTLSISSFEESIGTPLPLPTTFVEALPASGSKTFRMADIFAGVCAVSSLQWQLQASNPVTSTFERAEADLTVDITDYSVALDSFSIAPNPVAANGTATISYTGRGGSRLQIVGDHNLHPGWNTVGKYWGELILEGESGTYLYSLEGRHTPTTTYSVIYGQPGGPTVCDTYMLAMTCPFAYWIDEPQEQTAESCPSGDRVTIAASYQRFEHGVMVWDSDLRVIHILYDDGTNAFYRDYWDGQPITYPSAPPAGMSAPAQGFGYVWVNYSDIPSRLGWATTPEQPYTMTRQWVKNGYGLLSSGYAIVGPLYMTLPNGDIVRTRIETLSNGRGWDVLR